MRYLLFASLILFVTAAAILPDGSNSQSLVTQLGIPRPADVRAYALMPFGRPLPQKTTIVLGFIAQLEIYRSTLARGCNDAPIQEIEWERHFHGVTMHFAPQNGATWADLLFALAAILRTMLMRHGDSRDVGYLERTWEISRERRGARRLLIGRFTYRLEPSPQLKDALQDGASFPTDFNVSSLSTGLLSAPFEVPDSDYTLLIGARGADIPRIQIALLLGDRISDRYRSMVINHRAESLPESTTKVLSLGTPIWITLRPRMIGGVSQFTDTDYVETTVGIMYYMIRYGFFATKITAVRLNRSGRRIPVGEIEFSYEEPEEVHINPANALTIET